MDPELGAIIAVAGLLLVKEAGLPVPVPGDLLVLGAGVTAAAAGVPVVVPLGLVIGASIVGGIAQFGLLRGAARPALLRLLAAVGMPVARLDAGGERLRRGGARGVAVARMTPGVRILTIPAAALAGVPAGAFVGGLTIGNAVFVGGHLLLGFVIGEPVVTVAGAVLGPLAIGLIALAALGLAGWLVLARRRRVPALPAWTDASCPACLALAAAARAG